MREHPQFMKDRRERLNRLLKSNDPNYIRDRWTDKDVVWAYTLGLKRGLWRKKQMEDGKTN